jgi:phage terminase small subunit
MAKLTPKQALFVKEYQLDRNGKQAAIRAGYSPKSAEQQASRLLSNAKVSAAIDAAKKAREDKVEVKAERVLRELIPMALYDPADFTEVRCPADIENLPEHVRRAIIGWSWDTSGNFTLKFGKQKAVDQLMRQLGMFNDRLNLNVTDGLAERLRRAKERMS